MKKVVFSILTLSALTLGLFSCQKSQTVPTINSKKLKASAKLGQSDFISQLNQLGMLHNDCMDYMYNKTVLNIQAGFPFTNVNDYVASFTSDIKAFYLSKGWDESAMPTDFSKVEVPTLSSEAKSIMSTCDEFVTEYANQSISQEELEAKCNDLESSAYGLESEDEMNEVGSYVSIEQHSIEYWVKNIDKYMSIDGSHPTYNPKVEANKVATQDAIGALKGGITGAIGGGGLPGGIIGAGFGAACYSFGAAILAGPLHGNYNWLNTLIDIFP